MLASYIFITQSNGVLTVTPGVVVVPFLAIALQIVVAMASVYLMYRATLLLFHALNGGFDSAASQSETARLMDKAKRGEVFTDEEVDYWSEHVDI